MVGLCELMAGSCELMVYFLQEQTGVAEDGSIPEEEWSPQRRNQEVT